MAHVATIGTEPRGGETTQHREEGIRPIADISQADRSPAGGAVTEVHDSFTRVELIRYEGLGFAERFGGHMFCEAEDTTIGGRLPVDTSGGMTAKVRPPGTPCVAQCAKLFASTSVSAVTILEGPIADGR
jgi:acetyl-CoA C-acetyltransferase